MHGRGARMQLVAGATVVQRRRGDGETTGRKPGRRRPPPSADQAGAHGRNVSAVRGRLSEADRLGHRKPNGAREGVQRPDRHV